MVETRTAISSSIGQIGCNRPGVEFAGFRVAHAFERAVLGARYAKDLEVK
jgi:hypothetical protein